MKIYFAGSIRGGRRDLNLYRDLIAFLRGFGDVLTEHVGNASLSEKGEEDSDGEIYRKDMGWLLESDAVVAEVSAPSLGVGYEIGAAEAMGKPILCLYREDAEKKLSAMIAGNPNLLVGTYKELAGAKERIRAFFKLPLGKMDSFKD
ncbi:nucleoside 2-deoxyribosyltransferase [Candidatus Sumerlaeota bacterium]|nr:nucleoside 2-deoxyribosyltransferase [Candidatus Sumerlaeota bacterium]